MTHHHMIQLLRECPESDRFGDDYETLNRRTVNKAEAHAALKVLIRYKLELSYVREEDSEPEQDIVVTV